MIENRVLRRIFGSRRDKVTGEWRKLHSEELNDLYSSPSFVWLDLQEVGCGVMDSIGLAQDSYRWRALANAVMNLWVP